VAKDPAFLFYPGDYISGVMHLDFECKGAYVDLLMLQFNKDRMTIHMIKQVLGHKFEHIWSLISDKFREKDGFYWNERLRIEKEKRITFCESRRNNRNSSNSQGNHMSSHMENENNSNNKYSKYNSSKAKKLQNEERGIRFSENKLEVIFADGTSQKLGQGQLLRMKEGGYEPHYVKRGIIE